jgi:hypothetical protein
MTAVRIFSSFEDLPEETQRLFDNAGADCIFSGMPWFKTFAKFALDPTDSVRVYSANGGDSSSPDEAILPMVHRATDSGFFKARKLSSLSSYYTCLYGPIGNNFTKRGTDALARGFAEENPRWDEVELKPLDVDAPAFAALVEGLEKAGFVVQTYFCFGNWYLEVKGRSFAQYVETLPSVLRNTLGRKKKKLEKSGRAQIEIVTGGDGLESAIAAYNTVYLASWKESEPYPRFVPELIRNCAALGLLRLGIVRVDGEPAAAQFWIVHNGRALIYKLAYDERFAELSVGTILTATLMKHVIDIDGVIQVDYLTGDDAYKKDWMSSRRERWGILALNPRTLRGVLAIVRHIGGRAIKRAFQVLAKRTPRIIAAPQPAKDVAVSGQ